MTGKYIEASAGRFTSCRWRNRPFNSLHTPRHQRHDPQQLEIIGQQAERGMTSQRGNCAVITSVECQYRHGFVSFRQ